MKIRKIKKGFTLVELIVVIAILGILAAVIVPRFTGFQSKARGTQALVTAKQVATAIDAWQTEEGTWPAVTSANAATIKTTAGISTTDTTVRLLLIAGGGFTVEIQAADGNHYSAGRTLGTTSVSMINDTGSAAWTITETAAPVGP